MSGPAIVCGSPRDTRKPRGIVPISWPLKGGPNDDLVIGNVGRALRHLHALPRVLDYSSPDFVVLKGVVELKCIT